MTDLVEAPEPRFRKAPPVINPTFRTSAFRPRGALLPLVAIAAAGVFALLVGSASALPSDRAYEMVSPPDKNSGDVGGGNFVGAFRASEDGDHIAYNSLGGWGDAQTYGAMGAYVATRDETSWSSTSVLAPTFPGPSLFSNNAFAVSRDYSRAISSTNMDLATGEEIPIAGTGPTTGSGGWNYLRDVTSHQYTLLAGDTVDGSPYYPSSGEFDGADDYNIVYLNPSNFTSPLTEDAVGISGRITYRYSDGSLIAIGKNPEGDLEGTVLPPSGNPVSHDGKIVYLRGAGGNGPIWRYDYRASDDPAPEVINASENTSETVAEGPASFAWASGDGSVSFFTSNQRLVDADTDNLADLYRWDAGEPEGSRLTLVSADDESGDAASAITLSNAVKSPNWGASADGSRIYFTSNSQLVKDGPTTSGLKVFSWDRADGLRYIGIAQSAGLLVSDDGNYLGILTRSNLTGENASTFEQAYLYDYEEDAASCASCVAANTAAATWRRAGPASSSFASRGVPLRNVSDRGEVYFESSEALLPADTNGKSDVYLWDGEDRYLVSSGRSGDDSYFADADASGENVFFYTRSRLSAWDVDDNLDLYDARVDGGLPAPPKPEAICHGDDCQGDDGGDPGYVGPGTETYDGEGDSAGRNARACASIKRAASKLRRQARALDRKARHVKPKRAKRLQRRAKRTTKKARRTAKRAMRCNRRAK